MLKPKGDKDGEIHKIVNKWKRKTNKKSQLKKQHHDPSLKYMRNQHNQGKAWTVMIKHGDA